MLESAQEGLILVDKEGIITMTNQAFASIFNTSPERLIGRPVTEVYVNPKFPEVLQTGLPVYGHIHDLNGHQIIASGFPSKRDGVVVGAVGKVRIKNLDDLYS